jgi:hypothetical protein
VKRYSPLLNRTVRQESDDRLNTASAQPETGAGALVDLWPDLLDLGTEWSLSDRLMLSLGYRDALSDASTSHGAQIGMKYAW